MPTQLLRIRCNGLKQCRNCSQAALQCSYDAVPQKKGPKGSIAKIISELRETRKPPEPMKGRTLDFESPPVSPIFTRTPSLLNDGLIDSCADFFFLYLHVPYHANFARGTGAANRGGYRSVGGSILFDLLTICFYAYSTLS